MRNSPRDTVSAAAEETTAVDHSSLSAVETAPEEAETQEEAVAVSKPKDVEEKKSSPSKSIFSFWRKEEVPVETNMEAATMSRDKTLPEEAATAVEEAKPVAGQLVASDSDANLGTAQQRQQTMEEDPLAAKAAATEEEPMALSTLGIEEAPPQREDGHQQAAAALSAEVLRNEFEGLQPLDVNTQALGAAIDAAKQHEELLPSGLMQEAQEMHSKACTEQKEADIKGGRKLDRANTEVMMIAEKGRVRGVLGAAAVGTTLGAGTVVGVGLAMGAGILSGPLGWVVLGIAGPIVGTSLGFGTGKVVEQYYKKQMNSAFETRQAKEALESAYKVMDLDPKCTDDQLSLRYRTLMRKFHPDRQMNAEEQHTGSEQAMQINYAYDLITADRAERPLPVDYLRSVFNGTPSGKSASDDDDEFTQPGDGPDSNRMIESAYC
eukprot:541983-Prymnesium_polylepis.1